MGKKFFIPTAIAALMGVGGFFAHSSTTPVEGLSDLELENAEALADYESNYPCPDACMDWDGSSGGGIACDCGRYVGVCKRRCA